MVTEERNASHSHLRDRNAGNSVGLTVAENLIRGQVDAHPLDLIYPFEIDAL